MANERLKRSFRRGRIGQVNAPVWWILPALCMVVIFRYATMFTGGWYAFTDWNGISLHAEYIGLANFRKIVSGNSVGLKTLITTVKFAICTVLFSNVLGLFFALILNNSWMKSRYLLRTMIYIPVIMLPMAVSYIWKFIFQYNGPINSFFSALGLSAWKKTWLADPSFSFWAVVIVIIWRWAGRCMIIYLAGLQSISDDIIESSIIDGAGYFKRLIHILIPLVAPSMTITFTLTLSTGLNVFDEVMALTAGGPVGMTETLATLIYKETYAYGNFGYGAALSLVLTVFVVIVALGQLRILRKREEEMT